MTKYLKYCFFSLGVLLVFASCEKVIDVKLNTSPNQIVIEGVITNRLGQQTVTISESVPYTSSNTYPPVTGAQVTVTDDLNNRWDFVETKPGVYTFGLVKGEPGRKYTLKVNTNNTTYTAESTMPEFVKIDSIDLKRFAFGEGDGIKVVEAFLTDPADQVNQYRWVLKVNNVIIKSVFVDNDRLTNGNSMSGILFYDSDTNKKLESGDIAEVEMQCIDKAIFTYWFTLSQQFQNGPGGGVTPGNPPSNIDNNALGYFSAHTTEKKSITIL